ncbi:hypothetical protein EVAR_20307_1 [Eumeta japonica]|uniref:Uncharacterized protein n=1 Tax=Eumeta variegata TaxID=151549 RepID=A0A4C1VQP7_EUMVA|nr:hypothetical protein EVAR_20307_1 [Eumeta japonica]
MVPTKLERIEIGKLQGQNVKDEYLEPLKDSLGKIKEYVRLELGKLRMVTKSVSIDEAKKFLWPSAWVCKGAPPRLAAFMVRILKGFSSLLLLFIVIFAIVANLYIFELFTWEIIVAGMGLPWLGYLFGYVFARALKQPHPDALAISIETGVQNTGIAIFLLRYALPQPDADLTTVVPVSVAIMIPIPMMTIFAYQKIKGCITARNKQKKIVEEDNTPIPDTPEPIGVSTIAVEKEN